LFDIVFKQVGKRKNSGQSHVRTNSGLEIPGHHSRQNSANLERVREDSNDSSESQSSGQSSAIQRAPPIHVRRSTFFKYASKDWLRSQLKQVPAIPLNLYVNTQQATDRQHDLDRAHELSEDARNEQRDRSRSKPQNRDEQVAQATHIFNAARTHNKRILERSNTIFSSEVNDLRQMVHFGEVDEKISSMMFVPYNEALIATGQSGIHLIDFAYLPFDIQDGDTRNAQSRIIATDKGVHLTSMAIMNQGTSPIVVAASTDGCVKLRKMRRSLEGRLEIQDSILTSWRVAPVGRRQEIKLAWDETYLACSFQERNTAVVTLWDGQQERRVHRVAPVALENREVTCFAIMGNQGLKCEDLLAGTDDGGIWKIDTRSERYVTQKFGERMQSRTKNKVIGMDTSHEKVMAGYSDGTVKVWDVRKMSKELEKYNYGKREMKSDCTQAFAGSLKYNYFAHNLRADLFVRRKSYQEDIELLDPIYSFKSSSAARLFMSKPDPKILHPTSISTHPFNPFLAVATRPGESGDLNPGVISVWMPKNKKYS